MGEVSDAGFYIALAFGVGAAGLLAGFLFLVSDRKHVRLIESELKTLGKT